MLRQLDTASVGRSEARTWHVFTPEYPPDRGGVSGYTAQVVHGLRGAGDRVHVWCRGGGEVPTLDTGVQRAVGGFSRASLREIGKVLDSHPAPRRLLVQWVPHGFGWRSMNLPFCFWLWKRARAGDEVQLMVHEAFLQFREGNLRQDAVALVHRFMTVVLLQAATRVWMSTPAWERMWRPYAFGRRVPFEWLPIPSNIPEADRISGWKLRQSLALGTRPLVGHFSTHGRLITGILDEVLPRLFAAKPDCAVVLIGNSSDRYRDEFSAKFPAFRQNLLASGSVEADEVARYIQACDVLLEPYPEGITARRTSALAGLAQGLPVVSNSGWMTEEFWKASGAVALVPAPDPDALAETVIDLLKDGNLRDRLRVSSKAFYQRQFSAHHMLRSLRGAVPQVEACFASD